MSNSTIHHLSSFTLDPRGGNPAGVWVGDSLPDPIEMRRIAKNLGYSETAFVAPSSGFNRDIRYFSPEAEVSFCGHATIAAGVALSRASGDGVFQLETSVGIVPVTTTTIEGQISASLTSPIPKHKPVTLELTNEVIGLLGWLPSELNPSIPIVKAYAGAWHMVIAAQSQQRLNQLDYDFVRLKALMNRENLTTLQLIWRETETSFKARNPFPVGGVVEDPATGAAAAALGGYLRDAEIIRAPMTFKIVQGEAMGRPSQITVSVPEAGGIKVSGYAVPIQS